MRRRAILASLAILSSAWSAGAGAAERHSEKEGGFSFEVPEGWELRSLPGFKYKFAVGPLENGFAPNINVVDEPFPGGLDEYVKINLENIQNVYKDFKIGRREEFVTESGVPGVRVFADNNGLAKPIRQVLYFFDGGATKYVSACSSVAEAGEKYDSTFEAALKSFRLEEK